jgi:hypothetical protein
MAPLRETADLYPPLPEDEDWNTYPKGIALFTYLPRQGLGKKE